MTKLTFSGHDTFHCRQFWLKKAYDFVEAEKSFNEDEASLMLGVGKNMVTAIRYWARCFQVIDKEDKPTSIGKKLLGEKGWDPYLEDDGSLWLLHYWLVSKEEGATGFNMIFNELIRQRPEFNTESYIRYVHQNIDDRINTSTLKKDFTVFYRTYYADFKAKDIEESFTGILTELNLLKQVQKTVIDTDGKAKDKNVWCVDREVRSGIPEEVVLYVILDQNPGVRSIGFEQLYQNVNSPGSVFALNKEGLMQLLERISEKWNGQIIFSSEAGIRELQFKKDFDKDTIISSYYGK